MILFGDVLSILRQKKEYCRRGQNSPGTGNWVMQASQHADLFLARRSPNRLNTSFGILSAPTSLHGGTGRGGREVSLAEECAYPFSVTIHDPSCMLCLLLCYLCAIRRHSHRKTQCVHAAQCMPSLTPTHDIHRNSPPLFAIGFPSSAVPRERGLHARCAGRLAARAHTL